MDCTAEFPSNVFRIPFAGIARQAPSRISSIKGDAERLLRLVGESDGERLLGLAIREVFPGRIAVVSSFGAELAVILAMVARIDPALPVIFLDTGQHFAETLTYRDDLAARLGLTDIRSIVPDRAGLDAADPQGDLHSHLPDRCCTLRKAEPLGRALEGIDAWITGRKRFHGGLRQGLQRIETLDGRVKINPLANWSAAAVMSAFEAQNLPRHPLSESGYLSIGCAPCTRPSRSPSDIRSGRWASSDKTECGIHWQGSIARPSASPRETERSC